jgi:hypothetical protein
VKPDNLFLTRDEAGHMLVELLLLRSGARASFAEHRPDLGDTMNDWISHALEADPFWRFASAKVLSDSLACASAADVAQGSRVERMLVLEAA